MCDGTTLLPEDFFFRSAKAPHPASNPLQTLEEMEKEMINLAIKRHGGNISAIAAQLGITRQTLYNKMKKFGL